MQLDGPLRYPALVESPGHTPLSLPDEQPAVAPNPRRWLMLLALTGSLSMIFVDITVTAIAGPSIGATFGLSENGVSWIASSYLITLAALMAIGGRMGDLIGKRNAFLAGVTLFAAASALCGADRKSTRLNSSHFVPSRMPSSA